MTSQEINPMEGEIFTAENSPEGKKPEETQKPKAKIAKNLDLLTVSLRFFNLLTKRAGFGSEKCFLTLGF